MIDIQRNRHGHLKQQRGVAVITALLLTTLAITIVAGLFWQQQVQIRSVENQRLLMQKKWILRGALDWAQLILRAPKTNPGVDTLSEPWAVPLAETRLDQYVENNRTESEASDAALTGNIVDAQSRINLNNLARNGVVDPVEVNAFRRLLTNAKLDPELASNTADMIANTQQKLPPAPPAAPGNQNPAFNPADGGAITPPGNQPQQPASQIADASATLPAPPTALPFSQVDDLLAVSGVTPAVVTRLKDLVVLLPSGTPLNINTASAEVLAARIEGLSLADATALVTTRDRAYFRSVGDLKNQPQMQALKLPEGALSVNSSYFFVNGKVRLQQATLDVQTLISRGFSPYGTATNVVWVREN